MAFCFNFSLDDSSDTKEDISEPLQLANQDASLKQSTDKKKYDVNCERQAMWHTFSKEEISCPQNTEEQFNLVDINGVKLWYLKTLIAEENVSSSEIAHSLQSSDLVSHVYEGGLKVWECTLDLLEYMSCQSSVMTNTKVLDLGCGAGLLGISALLHGASHILFQDYNHEVIECYTKPAVLQTLKKHRLSVDSVSLISGDWLRVSKLLLDKEMGLKDSSKENYCKSESAKFDLILSSETIYNTDYYPKLYSILYNQLSTNGCALFAAKTHYFGVGGGTLDFTQYLTKKGIFNVEVAHKIDDGVCREILKVTWLHRIS